MKATDEAGPGVLLVDKPDGPTSHDIVARTRRALAIRRVGHTGTLDPFASGLLLLCIGRATRLVEYFHVLPKCYEASLVLGRETVTDDLTGEETMSSDAWRELDLTAIAEAAAARVGNQSQVPPLYSARKVNGRRAHRLARAGEEFELEPSLITVHSIEITAWQPPVVSLATRVSTGTYVRALARDLGRDLGCGAHLSALRRTAIGPFEVDGAVCADELDRAARSSGDGLPLLTPLEALDWLPRRLLSDSEAREISHGRPVVAEGIAEPRIAGFCATPCDDGPVSLVSGGDLVAVATRDGSLLRPVKVLRAA
ncbi:MAG: tRNA pseudouridine(55) synthase TruB [marine benthic group bacterium]|nr:tRNA pseudouridine(55) synthase TruB [Gemmatimonadota bacterium]